jgi:hypothetical protein
MNSCKVATLLVAHLRTKKIMATYVIVYENVSGGDASAKIAAAVKEYGTWGRITSKCWAVVTEETSTVIRDKLIPLAARADRIFVIRSGTEAAWSNAEANTEWLKKNL